MGVAAPLDTPCLTSLAALARRIASRPRPASGGIMEGGRFSSAVVRAQGKHTKSSSGPQKCALLRRSRAGSQVVPGASASRV